jgi:putative ABC transport system permease protein
MTLDYFRVMRVPIVMGRALTEHDTMTSPRVAIVNQQFVRAYLRDVDPIGQRIEVPIRSGELTEIVGVVRDMKQQSLATPVLPTIYVSIGQVNDSVKNAHVWFATNWIVRTHGPAPGLPDAMTQALRAVDPRQPFSRIRTMDALIDRSLTSQRFNMLLVGASALLAVVLSAAGLFGVISYAVAQRGHEMGVRLALGATAGQLVGSVVRQGALLGVIGVAIGLAGAFGLTRLLKTFVFGVSPTDPLTFASAALLLLGLTMLASLVPALRLTRLDPASVLRRG